MQLRVSGFVITQAVARRMMQNQFNSVGWIHSPCRFAAMSGMAVCSYFYEAMPEGTSVERVERWESQEQQECENWTVPTIQRCQRSSMWKVAYLCLFDLTYLEQKIWKWQVTEKGTFGNVLERGESCGREVVRPATCHLRRTVKL